MCFDSTQFAKAKIATTDIECYKLLKGDAKGFVSYFQKFHYQKGVIQPKVELRKNCCNEIDKGYHSYLSLKDALYQHRLGQKVGQKVCKFIIPAGTRYYANRNCEYVSETIMLIGRVKV